MQFSAKLLALKLLWVEQEQWIGWYQWCKLSQECYQKGSCFPSSFGGECSGTPPECKECKEELACEQPKGNYENLAWQSVSMWFVDDTMMLFLLLQELWYQKKLLHPMIWTMTVLLQKVKYYPNIILYSHTANSFFCQWIRIPQPTFDLNWIGNTFFQMSAKRRKGKTVSIPVPSKMAALLSTRGPLGAPVSP